MCNIKIINDFLRILQQPRQREINAFTSWASQHAMIVDSLDGLKADIEQFSCLDKFMEGRREVFLGEEDHWIHEKSDYRLMLLRYFISRGFRYIGEEKLLGETRYSILQEHIQTLYDQTRINMNE